MRAYLALALPALIALASACSPEPGPEAEIKRVIEQMQAAVEERNNAGVRVHIADSFLGGPRSGGQLDREDVRSLLAAYFLRYRDIEVLITGLEINADPGQPDLAAMAGSAALLGANQALPETARRYRFEGQWRRIEGDWRLLRLHWE